MSISREGFLEGSYHLIILLLDLQIVSCIVSLNWFELGLAHDYVLHFGNSHLFLRDFVRVSYLHHDHHYHYNQNHSHRNGNAEDEGEVGRAALRAGGKAIG